MTDSLILRDYSPADCTQLIDLFEQTVQQINSRDYSPEQIAAWTGGVDPQKWNQSFLEHQTLIAEKDHLIVGFADLNDQKHLLDRLYVAADHQQEGIATALCDALEKACSHPVIQTEASITARPFFEKRGYHVVKEQQVCRKGILLTNFRMEKSLS